MLLAVLFSLLGALLWFTALGRGRGPDAALDMGNLFLLTVGATWAVLIPAKFWTSRRGNTWGRRLVMLGLGGVVGLQAYWLHGETVKPTMLPFAEVAGYTPDQNTIHAGPLPMEVGYLSYYAVAFFALRWWRMTDRRRAVRFSFAPVLAAAFWGLLLYWVWQDRAVWGTNMVVLVLTSAVVQMVSPWEQPPPPLAKRLRLRCA